MNEPAPWPLTALALASSSLHPDDIPALITEQATRLGAVDVVIYLVDLEQRVLVPFGDTTGERLSVDGTVAGRAYRTEEVIVAPVAEEGPASAPRTRVWLPLLDSAERLGVIGLLITGDVGEARLAEVSALVNLTAEIIANKAQYGDVVAKTKRTRTLSVAAEMRWSTLPPLTFKGRNLTISGVLEPAYDVAGDTFDYAVNGDAAHVAILDALGHGLEAARIADLAVGAYRHGRRRNLDAVATYWMMDSLVATEFGDDKFATAQLATLSLSKGRLSWLNAGHPAPMVIRNGRRTDLVSEVCLPLGLAGTHGFTDVQVTETDLEPGDLVLFFTDGVVEARSTEGEEFGRRRLADLLERAALANQTPAETVRLLGHAVLDHQEGMLQDDATLLLLVWDGPPVAEPVGETPS